jgi:hypothetical protein
LMKWKLICPLSIQNQSLMLNFMETSMKSVMIGQMVSSL